MYPHIALFSTKTEKKKKKEINEKLLFWLIWHKVCYLFGWKAILMLCIYKDIPPLLLTTVSYAILVIKFLVIRK